mmetsp:Transcript_112819/g.195848  ORF Transcript_112819/g.195848 Transcript_112819/m.195848 type:complete len:200 (-) Transcript_112819:712-1311(-)
MILRSWSKSEIRYFRRPVCAFRFPVPHDTTHAALYSTDATQGGGDRFPRETQASPTHSRTPLPVPGGPAQGTACIHPYRCTHMRQRQQHPLGTNGKFRFRLPRTKQRKSNLDNSLLRLRSGTPPTIHSHFAHPSTSESIPQPFCDMADAMSVPVRPGLQHETRGERRQQANMTIAESSTALEDSGAAAMEDSPRKPSRR